MAITKNIITEILDSMNYNDLDAIEIVKDEFTDHTLIITAMNDDVTIDHVFYIDTKENNIMFTIRRDSYHDEFNEKNDNTKHFDVEFNRAYFNDPRIINGIDDMFRRFTNNFEKVKDMNDETYFDSILKFLWYNAETIYNDQYSFLTFTFKLLCSWMDDCEVQISFFNNYSMTYDI